MTIAPDEMLLDQFMAEFDATIAEHLVIDAPPEVVYRATRNLDFLEVSSPLVDTAMFLRGLPDKIARRVRNEPPPPAPPEMHINELFDGTADPEVLQGWLALGEVPDRELLFGAVGKVWQPDIEWKTVKAEEFKDFAEPDFAKIAVAFSLRGYGTGRTLLSYEARTKGTDDEASDKFLRYWWLVRKVVGYIMRAALTTIDENIEKELTATSA